MSTKLTLSLNNEIIRKAKIWAEIHHTSLSKVVEKYFFSLVSSNVKSNDFEPKTNLLVGMFESKDKNLSYKELVDKHKGRK